MWIIILSLLKMMLDVQVQVFFIKYSTSQTFGWVCNDLNREFNLINNVEN